MNQSLLILGRQPELGLAELESLNGTDTLKRVGNDVVLSSQEPATIAFQRLGGSIKLAKVLTVLETSNWNELAQFVFDAIPNYVQQVPAGKFKLGLSVHGLDISPKQLNATALHFKKAIKQTGRNVRVVPNKTAQLSSAQVLHNQLTSPTGWELLFVIDGGRTILAQTVAVQDIEGYAARDQARPKRDTKVGMLPPKLAQILINLANGLLQEKDDPRTLLDPFCGTGVVLQEAMLMGYRAYGTDIDARMITYSQANLDWLLHGHTGSFQVETADAMTAKWNRPFNIIASETYLGRPLSSQPSSNTLNEIVQDCNHIHKKFLKNLAGQTRSGFRLCLAIPAWKFGALFKHLPVIDQLTDIGYTRVSFVHSGERPLIYHRPDQLVGRELVTLIRK